MWFTVTIRHYMCAFCCLIYSATETYFHVWDIKVQSLLTKAVRHKLETLTPTQGHVC